MDLHQEPNVITVGETIDRKKKGVKQREKRRRERQEPNH